mmetsp:Transcript_60761/g.140368  ORF Transcript_60761/g.140368 Transcript_60761/m.140368 type:complete len:188 (+) Transcript_60761:1278-1841(+)
MARSFSKTCCWTTIGLSIFLSGNGCQRVFCFTNSIVSTTRSGLVKKHDRTGAFCRLYRVGVDTCGSLMIPHDFNERSQRMQTLLQEAYLSADPGFLRLLQVGVLDEWRKEDPAFCQQLELLVHRAKRTACVADRAHLHRVLGEVERISPTASKDSPVHSRPQQSQSLSPPPSAGRSTQQRKRWSRNR